MTKKTILLCATSERHLSEVESLVKGIRKYHKAQTDVVLYTHDTAFSHPDIDQIIHIHTPSHSFADKVFAITDYRADNMLYLDTDIELIGSILELFDLLKYFDLAAAHAPNRYTYDFPDIPKCFPELNTGVLLYKSSAKVRRFMKDWYDDYIHHLKQGIDMPSGDQPTFRKQLFTSNLRFTVLTPEYNCRFTMGSLVTDHVKILHGRVNDMTDVLQNINQGPGYKWGDEPGNRYICYRNTKKESIHLNHRQPVITESTHRSMINDYESKLAELESESANLRSQLNGIKDAGRCQVFRSIIKLWKSITPQK